MSAHWDHVSFRKYSQTCRCFACLFLEGSVGARTGKCSGGRRPPFLTVPFSVPLMLLLQAELHQVLLSSVLLLEAKLSSSET